MTKIIGNWLRQNIGKYIVQSIAWYSLFLRESLFKLLLLAKIVVTFTFVWQFTFVSHVYASDALEIDIYIKDHKFEPDVIEVPSGRKLRITVHNMDSTIEEFDSPDLKREKIIPGKSKGRIILAPLKVGEYHFIGEFHEETAKGKLVVVDKEVHQDKNDEPSDVEEQMESK